MKRGKILTSMSRVRFEELRQGILDGSLAERWKDLEGKESHELTRKQAVELRQISWLVCLADSNPQALRAIIQDTRWRQVKVFDLGKGNAETVTFA